MKTFVKTSMLALSLVSSVAMAASKPTLVQHMQGTPAPLVAGKSAANATAYAPTRIVISNDEGYQVNIYLPDSSDPSPVYLQPGYVCGGAPSCPANTDVIEDDYNYWSSVEVQITDQYGNLLADTNVPNHSDIFVSELVGYGAKAKAK